MELSLWPKNVMARISVRSSVSLLQSSPVHSIVAILLSMVCVPQSSVTPSSHNLSSSLP